MKLYELGAYLILVSFAVKSPQFIDDELREVFKTSSFDGVAVPYVGPYHREEMDDEAINSNFLKLAEETNKEIWPWVFLNRVIGYDPDVKGKFKPQKTKFESIPGIAMALNNETTQEFLNLWEASVRTAKDLSAPGIVFDLEPYNNKEAYNDEYLSGKMGITVEQVQKRLRRLGEKMAEIANRVYPEVKIHLLYSGLTSKKRFGLLGWKTRSVTYIVKGMLDYSLAQAHSVEYISGGELTVGYCNTDIDHLKAKISNRSDGYSELLSTYGNLKLSAPIAPWLDAKTKTGWMTRGNCAKSSLQSYKDFRPIYNELEENYKTIWLYLAGHSGFKLPDSNSMQSLYSIVDNKVDDN